MNKKGLQFMAAFPNFTYRIYVITCLCSEPKSRENTLLYICSYSVSGKQYNDLYRLTLSMGTMSTRNKIEIRQELRIQTNIIRRKRGYRLNIGHQQLFINCDWTKNPFIFDTFSVQIGSLSAQMMTNKSIYVRMNITKISIIAQMQSNM